MTAVNPEAFIEGLDEVSRTGLQDFVELARKIDALPAYDAHVYLSHLSRDERRLITFVGALIGPKLRGGYDNADDFAHYLHLDA